MQDIYALFETWISLTLIKTFLSLYVEVCAIRKLRYRDANNVDYSNFEQYFAELSLHKREKCCCE